MASEPFRPYCAVQVVLVQNEEVLLSRRCGTGFEDGKYGLIAGHIDGAEPARLAAAREAREESGVVIEPSSLDHAYTLHRSSPDREYIDLFFACSSWSGEPVICEPDRCEELMWSSLDDLPSDTIDYVRFALEEWCTGSCFGEFGWSAEQRQDGN